MSTSEEAKKRLAEHAKKNKGRTTLAGLDRVLAGVALDYAQEDREERNRCWELRASGALSLVRPSSWRSIIGGHIKCRYDEGRPVGTRFSVLCPWVRLSYAPDWLKDELWNRFGGRRIVFPVRGKLQNSPVFPLGPVVTFLEFLWPEDESGSFQLLRDQAYKYVTGHSEGYIQRWPGAGAALTSMGVRYTLTDHVPGPDLWAIPESGGGSFRERLGLAKPTYEVIG